MVRTFVVAAMLLFLAACSKSPTADGPVNHYPLTGVVLRLNPSNKIATIRHETIRGTDGKVWMEAMTMDFPVRDPQEFAKLKTDLPITARVNQKPGDFEYWIDQITARQ